MDKYINFISGGYVNTKFSRKGYTLFFHEVGDTKENRNNTIYKKCR